MADRTLIDKYFVEADHVPATISIWDSQDDTVPIYEITMPKIGVATAAILEELKDELAKRVPVEIEEVTDPKKVELLKQAFFSDARQIISKQFKRRFQEGSQEDFHGRTAKHTKEAGEKEEEKINLLTGITLHKMFGLGFVDVILADNFLEELAINGARNPISVYHKKHGWCKTTIQLSTEEEVYNLSSQIGRKVNREINALNPIMDAHLLTGDRVAATLFPTSTFGNTITIRRFSRNPWTIIHLIDPKNKTMSKEIAAIIWQAVHYELNIIIAGGTASGKTSVLSAISSLSPHNQRIISIEDTREIFLPDELQWNWVPMTTRLANPEGKGEVTMLDLMIAALRMRPDRIIVGEVRKKAQAETMFEAMHTGHSVCATMHADTVDQVKRRLVEPPIQLPRQEVESLHLVLVQYRDRRKGIRRTLELAEVLSGGKDNLEVNNLYRWHPRNDVFERTNPSIRMVEEMNIHTGMTLKEIEDDLRERESILQWMLDNNIKDIAQVGKVMKMYYKSKARILELVKTRSAPDFI